MKLANPFPDEVRNLYLYVWTCWICGGNGNEKCGLEINHITGRDSASAFNSSLLCHDCHSHICHSREEEQKLFLKTVRFLYGLKYIPREEDYEFMTNHSYLITPEVMDFLNQK